jgi:hypothetical protein
MRHSKVPFDSKKKLHFLRGRIGKTSRSESTYWKVGLSRSPTQLPFPLFQMPTFVVSIVRPLLVSDDNDEIFTLRRTMAKIRAINRKVKQNNFSRAQARVSVRIVKNDILKTNVDLFVVLVLPLNEVKKTVHVKDTEIADEFLAKIFVKYYQKKVPHKKSTDFVLKAAGLAEYIDGAFPLNTFEYIRSRVAKNLRIELVVVERPQRQDEDMMIIDNDSQSFAEDLSGNSPLSLSSSCIFFFFLHSLQIPYVVFSFSFWLLLFPF